MTDIHERSWAITRELLAEFAHSFERDEPHICTVCGKSTLGSMYITLCDECRVKEVPEEEFPQSQE